MKVINDKEYTKFEDLKKGDTFIFVYDENDDRAYMKIDEIDRLTKESYNAICLNSGNLYEINDDVPVFKVEAELHIS